MTTIFICIDWFYPAYKSGGPVQSIANLVENYNEGITYKIFCSNKDVDGSLLQNVKYDQWVKYNINTQVWYSSKKIQHIFLLQNEINNYSINILFINGIYSWNFNILPLLFCKSSHKIISVRGMLHPGALSQKKIKKNLYLFLLKLLGVHRKYYFHASNEDEKKYIEKVFGKNTKVNIAANFPRQFPRQSFPKKTIDSLQLISIALISPMKNHLLILEALRFCKGKIDYHIYGSVKGAAYWNECIKLIQKLPANIKVHVHGDLSPDKVEAALSNSHVFILPSKSENFGHAIYEALSAGKPVITSYNTPWTNLEIAKAGINVVPENTKELTSTINFFASMDQELLNEWSYGAHQYASVAIDVNEIKTQYDKMFFSDDKIEFKKKKTFEHHSVNDK